MDLSGFHIEVIILGSQIENCETGIAFTKNNFPNFTSIFIFDKNQIRIHI